MPTAVIPNSHWGPIEEEEEEEEEEEALGSQ
jgi:hypothetical protein